MGKVHADDLNRSYYAVIVADVRYDKALRPNAKLLYGELTALCNQYGYCWATNEYFADLYGISVVTVSRLISQLEKRGYIRCEMAATETGSERRIYAGIYQVRPVEGGIIKNDKTPLIKKDKGGLVKNDNPQYENNINITPYSPPGGACTAGPVVDAKGGNDGPEDGAVVTNKKLASRRRVGPKEAPDWKPERFAGFWEYYPRGESKQAAIRAWDRLRPSDELINEMAQALRRQMQSESWRAGVGIPYASTWLNNQRWTDVPKHSVAQEISHAEPLRGEGVQYQ